MTHAEFIRRKLGAERKIEKQWHLARYMTAVLLSPHVGRGKSVGPRDIVRLPMDSTSANVFDEETMEMLKRFMNNKK